MDGPFYIDSRPPFLMAAAASVTLAATNKALVPIELIPRLGSNYFSYIGKAMRVRMFGQITTGATPGNGSWNIYWGNGTDANGTIIGSSQTIVGLGANQFALSWELNAIVRCRTMGTSGSLMCTGHVFTSTGLSTTQIWTIPQNSPAAITCDLTAANVISVQFSRSGTTAEAIQVHDVLYEALN